MPVWLRWWGLWRHAEELHAPPAVTLTLASVVPLAVMAATPRRSIWRYIAVGAAYVWTFTVTWTPRQSIAAKAR